MDNGSNGADDVELIMIKLYLYYTYISYIVLKYMYNIFQSLDWPNMDNRADELDLMTTMMILCFMTIVIMRL